VTALKLEEKLTGQKGIEREETPPPLFPTFVKILRIFLPHRCHSVNREVRKDLSLLHLSSPPVNMEYLKVVRETV
jgi:hypothetical protein